MGHISRVAFAPEPSKVYIRWHSSSNNTAQRQVAAESEQRLFEWLPASMRRHQWSSRMRGVYCKYCCLGIELFMDGWELTMKVGDGFRFSSANRNLNLGISNLVYSGRALEAYTSRRTVLPHCPVRSKLVRRDTQPYCSWAVDCCSRRPRHICSVKIRN